MLHTSAGYLLQTQWSTRLVFDLRDDDVYWCTADIGWVTGHSYIVYGPLANGASIVMYEGAPDYPRRDRFWDIVERYKVSIFYSSATAVRAFMAWGTEWIEKHDLSSLRLLGTVGEPINPAAWKWYSRGYRQRKLPDRRYLVADGNRLDPDFAASRRDAHETRLRHEASSRRCRARREHAGRIREAARDRLSDHRAAVAFDAADHLWR